MYYSQCACAHGSCTLEPRLFWLQLLIVRQLKADAGDRTLIKRNTHTHLLHICCYPSSICSPIVCRPTQKNVRIVAENLIRFDVSIRAMCAMPSSVLSQRQRPPFPFRERARALVFSEMWLNKNYIRCCGIILAHVHPRPI